MCQMPRSASGSLCLVSFFSNNFRTKLHDWHSVHCRHSVKLYIFVLKLREQMCEVLLENHDWSLHLNKGRFDC